MTDSSPAAGQSAAWVRRCAIALLCLGVACLVLIVLAASTVGVEPYPWTGHRRTPEPTGMVFQIEAREVFNPFDRFDVFPLDVNGPAVCVVEPKTNSILTRVRILSYPEGRLLEEWEGPDRRDLAAQLADWKRALSDFDFDADGLLDLIDSGEGADYGRIRVLSGRDHRVLFEDRDPLEYEPRERYAKLGDVDGDGYAELAVIHPRSDRSKYDFELWDRIFGAKSWISFVSGARMAGR